MATYVDTAVVHATPVAQRLADAVADAEPRLRAIDEASAAAPRAPGKWSRKQILGHLIDSASNNQQRFVRMQQQPHLELPGYEQEHWVSSQRYDARSWRDIVDLWVAFNRHIAHLLEQVPADRLEHTWRTPEGNVVPLSYVAEDYVGHIHHHLRQIFE